MTEEQTTQDGTEPNGGYTTVEKEPLDEEWEFIRCRRKAAGVSVGSDSAKNLARLASDPQACRSSVIGPTG